MQYELEISVSCFYTISLSVNISYCFKYKIYIGLLFAKINFAKQYKSSQQTGNQTMESMKLIKTAALAGALGLAGTANAALITNGSFEENTVTSAYGWQAFLSSDVNGWDGSNIELWNNTRGVAAHEGSQFAELNAHPSQTTRFSIYQDFNTYAGQTYSVSFAYQARDNDAESFMASISGSSSSILDSIVDWTLSDHTTDGWSVFSATFQAQASQSRIAFTSLDPIGDTTGNFLDNVQVAAVSEPGTFALLGLGLVGLGFARKRA